jgi:hypothetical protein
MNASFAQDTMAETENGGHPEACEQARPHAEPVGRWTLPAIRDATGPQRGQADCAAHPVGERHG